MPDVHQRSSAELEYITWKATTYIVNKLWQNAVSCRTKLRHGRGSGTHIFLPETPPSSFFKNRGRTTGRWQLAGVSSTSMPDPLLRCLFMGSFCRVWKDSAPLLVTHSANFILLLILLPNFLVNFASSIVLLISWTRDCSSSDLTTGGVLLSACNATISLPQISSGWLKPGVVRISGMFCVRGSWSMCWKAAIPRRPLRGTTNK